MNFSAWFIRRPVGTTLLAVAITLVGAICYFLLPVSPLPQVEYPTINVGAGLPGASSETMASAVATPRRNVRAVVDASTRTSVPRQRHR